MSRARKIKKAGKYREYEITDCLGEVVIWGGGFYSERGARLNRMFDKRYVRGGDRSWGPAHGVKYHVPRSSYMQYKGRKQLPRDYYSRR